MSTTVWRRLRKLQTGLPRNPATLLLGGYRTGLKRVAPAKHTETHAHDGIVLTLENSQNVQQPTNGKTKKCSVETDGRLKVLPATCRNLADIVALSGGGRTQEASSPVIRVREIFRNRFKGTGLFI